MSYQAIEILENRIAPAGLINATFAAGKLILTGDAGDNVVFISSTGPNTAEIAGEDDTLIALNGAAPVAKISLNGTVTDFSADLGAGSDFLNLSGFDDLRSVTINGGDGNNNLALNELSILGDLLITGGSGPDTVNFSGRQITAGGIAISLGDDINSANLAPSYLSVTRAITYTGGAQNDALTISATNISVSAGINANLGEGDNSLSVSASSLELSAAGLKAVSGAGHDSFNLYSTASVLTGGISLTTGDGRDSFSISLGDTSFSGGIMIVQGNNPLEDSSTYGSIQAASGALNGPVSILTGNGPHAVSLSWYGTLALGAVTVKTGTGNDSLYINNNQVTAGKLTAELGEGENSLFLGGSRAKMAGFSYIGGEGSDSISFNLNSLSIPAGINILAGGGTNSAAFNIGSSLVTQNLIYLGGLGDDSVTYSGPYAKILGGVQVDVGAGTNNISLSGSSIQAGAIKTLSGEGYDSLAFNFGWSAVRGLSFATGEGNSEITIGGYLLETPSVLITTGSGDDKLNFSPGTVEIPGQFKIELGAGSNQAQINGANWASGGFSVLTGAGNDSIHFNYSSAAVGGAFQLSLGDGTNSFQSYTSYLTAASLSYSGGTGDDIASFNGSTVKIAGRTTFSTGEGNSSIGFRYSAMQLLGGLGVYTGSGNDSLSVYGNNLLSGAITVSTGAGADYAEISMNTAKVRGQLTFANGAHAGASSTARIAANELVLVGGVSANLGDGTNQFFVQGYNSLISRGAITALFNGGGNDNAYIYSNGTMVSAGLVTVTAGTDALFCQIAGNTHLAAPGIKITGSPGDDTVYLNAQSGGIIRGAVAIDLGAGANTGFISSDHLTVAGELKFISTATADQEDAFSLYGVTAYVPTKIQMGAGTSTVNLHDSELRGLSVNLGDGDDEFSLDDADSRVPSLIRGIANIIGGAGNDTFTIGANTANARVEFRGTVLFDGGEGADTLINVGNSYLPGQPKMLSFV